MVSCSWNIVTHEGHAAIASALAQCDVTTRPTSWRVARVVDGADGAEAFLDFETRDGTGLASVVVMSARLVRANAHKILRIKDGPI